MNAEELRALQAPIKSNYRAVPESAMFTLKAKGDLSAGLTCNVETGRGLARAGLHPKTGGDGLALCSGDMLLEALVACAGVTLNAVATALDLKLRDATVYAEGDIDARGTLGIDKSAPVGFREIRLRFEIDSDATAEQLDALVKLTERYCVVFQTLNHRPELKVSRAAKAPV